MLLTNPFMKSIYLFGGGPHSNSCIEIINQLKEFKIIGIVEKSKSKTVNDLKIPIIYQNNLKYNIKNQQAHISIGNFKLQELRKKLFNNLTNKKFVLPHLISKNSYVSKTAKIGEGTIVMNGCVINSNVKIGKNCIINTGSIIEHDVIINNHCIISPGVIINGSVSIGELSFLGAGCVIVDGLNLPKNSFIKANKLIKK